jgi:uncharacterized membrane protein YidH (DUF202 family)
MDQLIADTRIINALQFATTHLIALFIIWIAVAIIGFTYEFQKKSKVGRAVSKTFRKLNYPWLITWAVKSFFIALFILFIVGLFVSQGVIEISFNR